MGGRQRGLENFFFRQPNKSTQETPDDHISGRIGEDGERFYDLPLDSMQRIGAQASSDQADLPEEQPEEAPAPGGESGGTKSPKATVYIPLLGAVIPSEKPAEPEILDGMQRLVGRNDQPSKPW